MKKLLKHSSQATLSDKINIKGLQQCINSGTRAH